MVGGRGCVESAGGDYLITVAWQGLTPISAPPASVGAAPTAFNGAAGPLRQRPVPARGHHPGSNRDPMKTARPPSQRGFTLVELMVSMVLGLLIVLALITLLINVNRNNSELSRTNRLIENGRFALQLLQADVAHAGYWGGHVRQFDDSTGSTSVTPPGACQLHSCRPRWYRQFRILARGHVMACGSARSFSHYKSNLVGIAVQGTTSRRLCHRRPRRFAAAGGHNPQPNTGRAGGAQRRDLCLVGSGARRRSDRYFRVALSLLPPAARCSTDASRFVLRHERAST